MNSVSKSDVAASGVGGTSVSLTLLTCGHGQATFPFRVFYPHNLRVNSNCLLWGLRRHHSNIKELFFSFPAQMQRAEGRGQRSGFVLALWLFKRMPLSQASLRHPLYLLSAPLE